MLLDGPEYSDKALRGCILLLGNSVSVSAVASRHQHSGSSMLQQPNKCHEAVQTSPTRMKQY